MVGRSDLLEQVTGKDQLDLTYLLKPLEIGQFSHHETVASSAAQEGKLQIAVGAEYLDGTVEDLNQSREYESVTSEQRVLGSRVSCHRVRNRLDGSYKKLPTSKIEIYKGLDSR